MRRHILLLILIMTVIAGWSAPRRKIIDGGGSGPFKAEAVSDPTLPGFVVYRPADYKAAVRHEGPLPLVVFANGACDDTSLPFERMLSDLASYGYLVVGLGEMQDSINDRKLNKSPNTDLPKAVDWAQRQSTLKKSPYFKGIDMEYVAFTGMSCGGAQVMAMAADPRVKTYIMFNSGMGDIQMSGADRNSLRSLHAPVLYMLGGDDDIALENALLDYERISHVPVAFANHQRAGHGGTYHELYGGSFSRMARAWLGWQFKDRRSDLDVFIANRLHDFPDFTMKAKNFPETNEPFDVKEMSVRARDGKNIRGRAYIPTGGKAPYPTVVMAHGYNGTWREPKPFAETLAMRGVASFVFDFCGGSNASMSDGSTEDMSIISEKENLEDVTRAVKTWSFVDADRLGLLGCSQGGLVAALTAAASPDDYKALVLVYPALMIPETAPAMLRRFDADGCRPQEFMGMRLGRQFYEKIDGMNVYDSIASYRNPVFIVYGDRDMVAAGADRAKEKYGDCETLVVPGGDHGFTVSSCHEQATRGIADFVVKKLNTPKRGAWRMKMDPFYPDLHDPVMAMENGRYYIFMTGMGVGMMSSDDMKTWRMESSPLGIGAEWAVEAVPGYEGHTWAPDIVRNGDRWYLYYSCSSFGKNLSAIGVATNRTLDPSSPDYKWEDRGMVIGSKPGVSDWNAIDPNVHVAGDGTPWLTFGSFWDGIQLVRLEKDMKTPAGKPITIARRRSPDVIAHGNAHANNNPIEAPFITHRDGWYYLWVSYDYCCRGASSNYKTAVGRSRSIEGPYVDREGRPMTEGGGEIILGATDDYNGIGHCSVYDLGGDDWHFLAHAYDRRHRSASKIFHRKVEWTADGWPEVRP